MHDFGSFGSAWSFHQLCCCCAELFCTMWTRVVLSYSCAEPSHNYAVGSCAVSVLNCAVAVRCCILLHVTGQTALTIFSSVSKYKARKCFSTVAIRECLCIYSLELRTGTHWILSTARVALHHLKIHKYKETGGTESPRVAKITDFHSPQISTVYIKPNCIWWLERNFLLKLRNQATDQHAPSFGTPNQTTNSAWQDCSTMSQSRKLLVLFGFAEKTKTTTVNIIAIIFSPWIKTTSSG